jgi:hypothetical protein
LYIRLVLLFQVSQSLSTHEFSICPVRREMLRVQLSFALCAAFRHDGGVGVEQWLEIISTSVNASRDMSVFGPSAQLASSGIMSVYISTGRGDAVRDGKLGGCMELELLSDMC